MNVSSTKTMNWGLLCIRVGVGVMFIRFGVPKLIGGPERWEELGGAMATFGITVAPVFWGFMAAFSEAVGGLALLVGVLFRPFCFLLLATMLVAVSMLMGNGADLMKYAHALNLAIVFFGLLISGPGSYNLGKTVSWLNNRWYQ